MNDKYTNLENEYKSTVKELADITGWTNQQSEKVLALLIRVSETKAGTVARQNRTAQKDAAVIVSFHVTCKTQDGPTFRYARIRENPGTRLNTRFFRGKPLELKRKFCNLAKWDCKIFLPVCGPKVACAA